mmetsp:Transcript_16897/g.34394  ORF Transcript_16897/g.34394 Transcript_16897/m.34394 type:complete len:286 (-) Transcript_16897:82-939(-)
MSSYFRASASAELWPIDQWGSFSHTVTSFEDKIESDACSSEPRNSDVIVAAGDVPIEIAKVRACQEVAHKLCMQMAKLEDSLAHAAAGVQESLVRGVAQPIDLVDKLCLRDSAHELRARTAVIASLLEALADTVPREDKGQGHAIVEQTPSIVEQQSSNDGFEAQKIIRPAMNAENKCQDALTEESPSPEETAVSQPFPPPPLFQCDTQPSGSPLSSPRLPPLPATPPQSNIASHFDRPQISTSEMQRFASTDPSSQTPIPDMHSTSAIQDNLTPARRFRQSRIP